MGAEALNISLNIEINFVLVKFVNKQFQAKLGKMIDDPNQEYRLRWNKDVSAELNLTDSFKELRSQSEFLDVSLGCSVNNGAGVRTIKAHKLILASYSSVFRDILKRQSSKQDSMVYLRGVSFVELESILDFMYNGEVNITKANLKSFLAVAEELQIKGLQLKQQNNNALNTAKRARYQEEHRSYSKEQNYETVDKYIKNENFERKKYVTQVERPMKLKREDLENGTAVYSGAAESSMTNGNYNNDDSDGEPIPEGQIGNVEDFIKNIDKHYIQGTHKRTLAVCRICRREMRRDRIRKHIQGVHKSYVNGEGTENHVEVNRNQYESYEIEGTDFTTPKEEPIEVDDS